MDFIVNSEELGVMYGLPHIQQLAYLRGIRPYMDVKTGITGIKRRISYQSISEQLYIEPHQGIKNQNFSRDQIRRAVAGLARAGMLVVESEGRQLILKCRLASQYYSVQNKAAINPPQKATIPLQGTGQINTGLESKIAAEATIGVSSKSAIPHKDNYIYLLQRFEKFWLKYPEKKSKEHTLEIFKQLNPSEQLLEQMLVAIDAQLIERNSKVASGEWVPAWKYPANWLNQKCWEDEIQHEMKKPQEKRNAKRRSSTTEDSDPFWTAESEKIAESYTEEYEQNNVIEFKRFRES